MKIKIDTERCTGHGQCHVVAPDLFTDDDAGYGEVKGDGALDEASRAQGERAVAACPEQAITIEP